VPSAPAEGDSELRSRATLGDAIRLGVGGFIEEIVTFLMSNAVWALLVGLVTFAILRVPAALLLAPLIAPLSCGLARVATETARDRVVSPRTFISGVTDRFWAKLGIGVIQAIVLLVAVADLLLAPAIGGLPAVASLVLAIYVAVSSLAYGLVFWTLISDPELRAMPVPQIARLALAVVLRHPGQVAFLFVFAVLAAAVAVPLIPAVLFLPSIVLLTVAAYVLPAAEEIRRGA
jgi:hypothetical protein